MAAWEDSLDDLVRTRGSALVGYAYLLCGDRREAEDLVQDALVKTYSRGRAGLRATNVEGYVRRAVLTTYLDGFRRRRRWAAVRHLVSRDDSSAGHEGVTTERLDVQDALRSLAPRERACVVLRFYEDLTVAAIAEELLVSQGAVKRYLSDGVRRMEALLGPLPTGPTGTEDAQPKDSAVSTTTSEEITVITGRTSR
ncbi:sigma-70 family RNA polymerase sigma factor [Actinotalea sp. K2]|uniref:sigma-70 family RNA polymerase sigma factor n=1 Tax=Actinotalea sp. K2 TaxID=2939438 RepID=UPI002016A826|nr:sigma-70 family RNA polymerase sigma factor [Actinotalea sp. K2]MCL3861382.1 sigma-70 family RNA polymerase sigma factor [Actinotalea sp. K2]